PLRPGRRGLEPTRPRSAAMDWARLPDAALERAFMGAITVPADISAFQRVEQRLRRVATPAAWAEAAAMAHLGTAVCAALRCSGGGAPPDWALALQRAAGGRLRCFEAPAAMRSHAQRADRSGHAAAVVQGDCLAVFGGAQRQSLGRDPAVLEHPRTAVAELAVLDLLRGAWLEVQEQGTCSPAPRVRPTLTPKGLDGAILVGGQTFSGPGVGCPFGDVWTLECKRVGESATRCRWVEVTTTGCDLPKRSCHTAVLAPCGLVVVGGAGVGGCALSCEAYCLTGNTWHSPSQSGLFPPHGALHHGCCHRNQLVLIGGVDEAGLQRRALGRPTDVHVLCLSSWVWERLARHPLSPALHSRAAPLQLGQRIYIIGGDPGNLAGSAGTMAVLHLSSLGPGKRGDVGARKAEWSSAGVVDGTPYFAAAGHSVVGGVLLGGLDRSDRLAPVALLVPDAWPSEPLQQARPAQLSQGPRWFRRR
ncbi:unnamed protein product, partial [Prorocentrum cordatum]